MVETRANSDLQISIDFDPIKRRSSANRYWTEESPGPLKTQFNQYNRAGSFSRPSAKRLTTASVLGLSGKMSEAQDTSNKPVEVTGFKAYSSILHGMSAPAAPSGQKSFRKPQNVSKKDKALENCPDHELTKLQRVQKYLAKAQRAETARVKAKKQQQQSKKSAVTTISLDSSSEDDDVIEIPVPPPPLVCLDDSDDDSMQAPAPKPIPPARASRCSSPSSSIISDDFIAPLDRNCLSDSMDSVNFTEEELRTSKAKTTVGKALEKKGKESSKAKSKKQSAVSTSTTLISEAASSTSGSPETASATCAKGAARQRIPLLYKNLIASQKDVTIEHYHEDASHADDVVLVNNVPEVMEEPESAPTAEPPSSLGKKSRNRTNSAGDSVYSKGSGSNKAKRKSTDEKEANTADATPSSDSEPDDGVSDNVPVKAGKANSTTSTTKTRTSKKRKSITEESSPSDSETVPYIHNGEAVAHAQSDIKKSTKKKRKRENTLTKTDTAFMSMISTIAQGGEVSDSESVEMLPSTIEEVTFCSSADEGNRDNKAESANTMTFNDFPHNSVLKLVPIERKEEWLICDADKVGPQPVARIRCLNCHQLGHVRSRCSMPYKPPTCYMCGETGHLEPRCRNTLCLMVSDYTVIIRI